VKQLESHGQSRPEDGCLFAKALDPRAEAICSRAGGDKHLAENNLRVKPVLGNNEAIHYE
jgi:hypothetical protein